MAVTMLLCHAHQDARMVKQLKNHLSSLERKGLISIWDDGDISPGTEWKEEIDKHLNEAQVILLLISSSFMASNFCYKVEMRRAIERHERREARVIPVILRPVDWEVPPLDKLQPLPDHARAIATWPIRDTGYKNVTDGIIKVIGQWNAHSLSGPIEERKSLIAHFNQLIETIKVQMQPPGRATATANTLQQLSVLIPIDVTLADLALGWRTLAQAFKQHEEPATSQRRVTCGELANMASQLATGQGNLAQAIKAWHSWREAFKNSDDPRQATMVSTFAGELTELQDASH